MDLSNSPRSINEGTIHLWTADLKRWLPLAQKLKYLLSSEELDRLDRRKITSKKEEFLCSRGILRIILSRYTAEDPQNQIIKYSSTGKPFLPDSKIEFNISHSRDLFLCGISSEQKIGLDIQEVYAISSMDRIIRNHFSPAEMKYLQDLPTRREYQEHFFAIWTAKEAYFKGVGDGINGSFKKVSVLSEKADPWAYHLSLPGSPPAQANWNIKPIEVSQGYCAALAYEGSLNDLCQFEITPENYFASQV